MFLGKAGTRKAIFADMRRTNSPEKVLFGTQVRAENYVEWRATTVDHVENNEILVLRVVIQIQPIRREAIIVHQPSDVGSGPLSPRRHWMRGTGER
jgi:hypothetical protein